MSAIKFWCRFSSVLSVIVFGLLSWQGIARASAAPGTSESGIMLLIAFGAAGFGLFLTVFLWWMGNVHDYLRDLVKDH